MVRTGMIFGGGRDHKRTRADSGNNTKPTKPAAKQWQNNVTIN
jgi:hypothetical protein